VNESFLSRKPKAMRAFTLLELIIVMGIIVALFAVIVPATTSLFKSSGRKGAVSSLLGAIEQAHTLAIKDGQPTYVVFPTLPSGSTPALLQRYSYRSYAIFQDDAANPGTTKQVTSWQTLPTGISIRSGSLSYLSKTKTFNFSPIGATDTEKFPFLKFEADGGVDPSSTKTAIGTVDFGLFEGQVDSNGNDQMTSSNKTLTDTINVSRLTGRATYSP
jgi:type II secretory pathway pseudopilin PulG